ncbi:MAG: glycerophosphodiester phosphodiesterase family protein [Actinomycetota bacterium]|nr:glycerophosphodiester phosphodiesterase family protein [Actinomycetota bacterium]
MKRTSMLLGGVLLLAACSSASDDVATTPGSDNGSTTTMEAGDIQLPEGFEVQGHRGARGLKPENTLPSFETALDLGVSTLELDLHYSADGDIVVWHDPVIDPKKCGLKPGAPTRVPDPDDPAIPEAALAVRSLAAADLWWFDCSRNPDPNAFHDQDSEPTLLAGDDFGIVTLDALIDFVEDYSTSMSKTELQREGASVVGYNVEPKRGFGDPSAINDGFDGTNAGPFELRLLEVIEDRRIRERIMVQSFIRESLEAIHRADPGIRLAALTVGDADPGGYAALGISVWSPRASTISERRLAEAFAAGLTVVPWTVNSPEVVEALIAAGVDGVITDRPDLILRP